MIVVQDWLRWFTSHFMYDVDSVMVNSLAPGRSKIILKM